MGAARASGRAALLRGTARSARWAWRTFPGDILGWMVMRGSGVRRPTRIVKVGDVTAYVVEDERIGRYMDTAFSPIHAQAVGRYVFCRGPADDDVLSHEAEHIRQWRRLGPFYLPAYFAASLWGVYRHRQPHFDNFLEAAARRRADRDRAVRESRAPGEAPRRIPEQRRRI